MYLMNVVRKINQNIITRASLSFHCVSMVSCGGLEGPSLLCAEFCNAMGRWWGTMVGCDGAMVGCDGAMARCDSTQRYDGAV